MINKFKNINTATLQGRSYDNSLRIIIPHEIVKKLKLRRYDKFLVYRKGNQIIYKKIGISFNPHKQRNSREVKE